MRANITCLTCGGVDNREHQCALGTLDGSVLRMLCNKGKHKDFCTQCQRILNANFRRMLAKKKRIRIEGEPPD